MSIKNMYEEIYQWYTAVKQDGNRYKKSMLGEAFTGWNACKLLIHPRPVLLSHPMQQSR